MCCRFRGAFGDRRAVFRLSAPAFAFARQSCLPTDGFFSGEFETLSCLGTLQTSMHRSRTHLFFFFNHAFRSLFLSARLNGAGVMYGAAAQPCCIFRPFLPTIDA